ncbi:MAG TPA: PAS domain-containing protein, partial [Candidatus Sulfomarinibacteraceae bacterium]|nr:PAS domain-containing protein [Candidatus Sulfomarinibacteraceae bacterium]
VVAGGLGILAFEALIAPYLDPALDIEIAARLVAAAYPLVDVALLGIAAWIVFAGIGRTVAATLLGAYVVAQLGADWIYGLDVLAGTLDKARPEFVLWPAGMALLGAAALHPSMADLTTSDRAAPSVQRRVLVLGAAAVAGPVVTTLAAMDLSFETPPLAALSALVVGLVAARVGLLAGDVRAGRLELAQLQATRARIEALLETSGAIIWSGRVLPGPDAETVTEFASDQMLDITGFAADDFVAARVRWVDRIHPDDSGQILDQFRAWIHAESDDSRTEDALSYRYRFIHRDGEVRWLSETVKVSERDGDIPTRVTGVILDVTAEAEADHRLRQANRRLEASEQRYQDLIDNMAAVTWSAELVPGTEADIRRLFMSPQVEDLTGHAAAAFLGGALRWRDVIHPDDRAAILERLAQGRRRAFKATGPDDAVDRFSCEYRIVASNGEIRWVRDMERIIRGADGLATGIHGLLVDITERRERESRVQTFNQELEVLVARRVAELTDARTEAERANRAKSEFLSSMSHELRTPLNAILGFGQLLEMAPLPQAERESAAEILRAGRHLLTMIEGVLDFSRLDAGRVTLSIEPLDLGSLVRETVDLARPTAEGHEVTIVDLVSRDDPPVVLADRGRLAQVLLNLLSNASKFNRVGGTVTLTACRTNGRARILVADTGVGIEPERLAHIFEPLDVRPGELASRRSVGLGLALSSRLVALMDGALTVTSELGNGSTFTVELPIAAAAEPRDPSTPEIPVDRVEAGPARATILYIEDDLANLHLIERVLATRSGVRMLAAMQGRLGLELAREHRPDLILLDLHLPDVEPEETLRDLRSDERTRDIPVIVLSSDSSASLARRMVELGALDFVTKPFDMPRLLALVDGVLGKP